MKSLISIPLFIISFAVGMFFVYCMGVEPRVIHIYPSPDNIDKYILKDKADNCFKSVKKQVSCPLNKKDIAKTPMQE